MKARNAFVGLAIATAGVLGSLCSSALYAQQPSNEQFFPVLVYRTGAYAPNGAQWANGYLDYLKLTNARGGINGVKVSFEECETAYATDRGIECYERLKNKNGGATLIQPLSTGVTFAVTEKADVDKIPIVTFGYGRSESADGGVFKWNFPLGGNYWVAADIQIQHIGKMEGGLDNLKGKKIAFLYHDSPYGKEGIPLFQERARRHGFDLMLLPVAHPGVEQRSVWLQVRRDRPDYVILWGWGIMNTAAIKEAIATGYPRERMLGIWWSGSELDVADAGQGAKGYKALTLQHGAHPDSKVIQEVIRDVYDKGQGTGPRSDVGSVLHMRGLISAMLGIEGVRAAQERFGVGKVMTGEQTRWGLENLNLTQAKLDALGFSGVMQPIKTSCNDHMGAASARVHTWDGSKFVLTSDWYQADMTILSPMIRSAADSYATEKKIQRRTPADCQN